MPDKTEVWPKRFIVNDRLELRVGFKNSRVEVVYDTRIPLIGRYTLVIEKAERPFVQQVSRAQQEWVALCRMRPGVRAHVEIPISKKVNALVGFEDRRIEIQVKVVFATYTITLNEKDEPMVREALAEADRFDMLPDFVREEKGGK